MDLGDPKGAPRYCPIIRVASEKWGKGNEGCENSQYLPQIPGDGIASLIFSSRGPAQILIQAYSHNFTPLL